MRTPILIRAFLLGSTALAAAAPALPSKVADGVAIPEARQALDAARRALDENSIAAARFWSERAAALLAAADAKAASPKFYPLGNASQLLEVLKIYTFVAHGANPDLDAQAAWLSAELEAIRWLDGCSVKPAQLGERSVDYSPFTYLVRRMGDVAVDRNPFTHQIRRVGDIAIDYNPFTLEPRRIGEIAVDHDPFTGALRSIAGVALAP